MLGKEREVEEKKKEKEEREEFERDYMRERLLIERMLGKEKEEVKAKKMEKEERKVASQRSPARSPSPMSGLLRCRRKNQGPPPELFMTRSGSLRPVEALSPLKEGPDGTDGEDVVNRGEGKWTHWMRAPSVSSSSACKKSDLRLLLGVLGAPLAPVHVSTTDPFPHLSIKDIPIVGQIKSMVSQNIILLSGVDLIDGILLESKIQEARSKKDNLKARAQSAKTATKVSEMLGNVNTSSALSAFEKMEEKVMTMESQAEALGQLTSDDLEGKFLSYFVARRAFSFLSCLHQADHAAVDYVSYAKNLPAY
ncbi:hypothetical protein P8452_36533 [Trifolium repens]|nr:hypothetical protein P8452_36533 [Trifolium repens]